MVGLFILGVSPRTAVTGEGADDPCDHAREATSWDVIMRARRAGWYAPTENENPDPIDGARELEQARS